MSATSGQKSRGAQIERHPSCHRCFYFQPIDGDVLRPDLGECWRYPPAGGADESGPDQFAITRRFAFCSEFLDKRERIARMPVEEQQLFSAELRP